MLRHMQALARTLSIIGHPVVMLPLAAWLVAARDAGDARTLVGLCGFGALVLAWSWWQVRRGRWQHVDASTPRERRSLNLFLLAMFTAGTLLAWRFAPREAAWAIGLSLPIIALAIMSARWCKLSLHVAFATYAALLLWQLAQWATLLGLVFTALLAWSRLALARHVARDIAAGAAAGSLSGLLFRLLAQGAG
jgi:hypothetical protein